MQNTTTASQLLDRLIAVIEDDILPLTRSGVASGNKIFGAALLHKRDLSTVLAETNNEMENPLWHGEMHLLKQFYEIPTEQRPAIGDLIFLSTHEPCSLCLSAITWTGFDNFYYFFSHQDSRDEFSIPHDLKILKEVFGVEPGGYNTDNAFWQCHSLGKLYNCVDVSEQAGFQVRMQQINAQYAQLSDQYQSAKDRNQIPLN